MKVDKVEFDLDAGTISSATPVVLTRQTFTNDTSTEQEMSFSVNRSVATSSTFEYSTGFTVTTGMKFNVGIPFIADNTFSVEVPGSNTWTWGSATEYSTQYTATFPVKAPAHTAVHVSAVVTQGMLNVPYTMHLSSKSSGVKTQTTGTWHGVSSWDLRYKIANVGEPFGTWT